jgi:hypothetical protein
LIILWIGIHLDGWFERLDDSFRWWRVESTTVSDWLLLIDLLAGDCLNPGYMPDSCAKKWMLLHFLLPIEC